MLEENAMAQQSAPSEEPIPDGEVGRDHSPNEGPFNPLTWLTRVLIVALCVTAALAVVSIVSEIAYHDLIQRLIDGRLVSLGQAQAADERRSAIGSTQIVLVVVTGILFIVWFHRAYQNLGRLGVFPLRWGSGWAVGGWFVPFLNFVRPKAMANDIWRGSDPDLPAQSGLPSGPVPWFHTAWWAAFIASGLLSRVAVAGHDKATLPSLASSTMWGVASDALTLIAAVLAVYVVRRTASRQRDRFTRLARTTDAAV